LNPDSEQELENATLRLFEQLGWQTLNCFDEMYGDAPPQSQRAQRGHPAGPRRTDARSASTEVSVGEVAVNE